MITLAVVPALLLPRVRRPQEAVGAATEAAGATPSAAPSGLERERPSSRGRLQTTKGAA
jgi:hypothetical protein